MGGAKIFDAVSTPSTSIIYQLQHSTATTYTETDLLIIDGGGNDFSALFAKLLGVLTTTGTAQQQAVGSFLQFVAPVVGATKVGAYQTQMVSAPSTTQSVLVTAGNDYMGALATKFIGEIKTNALDKGATHVVLMNIPNATKTPRVQTVVSAVIAQTKAANLNAGDSDAVATAKAKATGATVELVSSTWISTFNTVLKNNYQNESRVTLVDAFGTMTAVINALPSTGVSSVAINGFTNVKDTSCPATGVDEDDHLPTYTFSTCTISALSAQTPPQGAVGGSNWWKTYLFSDSFHPSLAGHGLIANKAYGDMIAKNW